MALKFIISTLEEVAEPLRGEYEPKDGKFQLKVEGHPDAARIVEFRNNNVALMKEKTELTTKLEAALAKTGDSDDVVKLKLKLAEAESATAAATQKHDQLVFRSRVSAEFLAAGGRPEAVDFILTKVPFKLVDGELQPTDAATPTMEDYLRDAAMAPATSFAFLPSKGGGARGDRGKPPTLNLGGSNVRELVNPTPQELGANADAIKAGKAKVVITT